jgi:DNA gyrase subunit A
MAESIQSVQLSRETRIRYLRYAVAVMRGRALPDARDGLKPVQRRILYTMYHDLHLHFDAQPRKCAKIVGDVMGNYHPHGDSAIYDALVRLAQDWVMRVPLVHGQGNFGSVDGDPPAAYRYTEAKLAAVADLLLAELDRTALAETDPRPGPIRLTPNFEGTRDEPTLLPAQFPNLLVNGASGIAVGLATNIPPHNLGEVIRACVLLIDQPQASLAELMQKIKGPDFPLGGKIISDKATLRKIYEEGQGSIKIQGEWKLEEQGRKQFIVITSIPYGVDKGALEREMGAIIEDKKLPQVLSLTNEMNERDGLRISMEIKAGTDPNVVMAYFFKHTALQQNFAYNMTCLVPDELGVLRPQRLGLRELLRVFLDFRLATVRRRFEYDLEQLRRRIHLLEGFKIVFNALDQAIKLIREASGKAEAGDKLMQTFGLDDVQVEAILEAQLYKLAKLEIQKILDELRDKQAQAEQIEAILASEAKLWGIIKAELQEIEKKYSDRRRTRIASDEDVPQFDESAYIQRENTNVVLTRQGWVKRVGRLSSVESTRVREGDEVQAVVPGSTLDHAIFFADDGTAYTARMHDIPASSGHGVPLSKLFKLSDQVRMVAVVGTDPRFVPATSGQDGPLVVVVTAGGFAVRLPLALFAEESTKSGRRYVKLAESDKVVFVDLAGADASGLLLASSGGRVLHVRLDDIPAVAGPAKGVVAIQLADDETCLGAALVRGPNDGLTVETSSGKLLHLTAQQHPPVSRGNKGTEVVKRLKLLRVVPPTISLPDWDKVESARAESNGKSAPRDGGGLFA